MRTIHRIWIEGSPVMPDEFVKNGELWRELNPDWNVLTWSKPSFTIMNECIYKKALAYAPKNDVLRFKADLLRLEILYQFGGLYVDVDIEPLRPIGKLLDSHKAAAAYSPNLWKGNRVLSNAFMWAQPKHTWIRRCIIKMHISVQAYRGTFLAMMTGPHHVNRCLKPSDMVGILPTSTIYPTTVDKLGSALCFHSWANKAKMQKEAIR